jgi:hypothetical protein
MAGIVTAAAPIAQHPARDRGVGHNDPALGHHRGQVAVAQPVGDVLMTANDPESLFVFIQ